MEIYLLLAMFLAYMITVVFFDKQRLRRVWLGAFIVIFVMTAVALSFWRITNQEIMMNVVAVSWYYILYLSLSVLVVLGIINLWIFKKQLWKSLFENYEDDDVENDI